MCHYKGLSNYYCCVFVCVCGGVGRGGGALSQLGNWERKEDAVVILTAAKK